jgi:hypothetical protein
MVNTALFYYILYDNNLEYLTEKDIDNIITYNSKNCDIYCLLRLKNAVYFYSYNQGWKYEKLNISFDKDLDFLLSKYSSKNLQNIFIYYGHSDCYYLHSGNKYINIYDVFKNITFTFDLIILDSCLSSSLEFLYDLRKYTKLLMGNEQYSFDTGFIDKEALVLFDTDNNLIDICKYIMDKAAIKVNKDKDTIKGEPWIGSLLKTDYVDNIVKELNKVQISLPKFKDVESIRVYSKNNLSYLDLYRYIELITPDNKELLNLINESIIYTVYNVNANRNLKGLLFSPKKQSNPDYKNTQLYSNSNFIRNVQDFYMDNNIIIWIIIIIILVTVGIILKTRVFK